MFLPCPLNSRTFFNLFFLPTLSIFNFCSGLLGEVDNDLDTAVDWDSVRGEPLDGIILSGGQ